MIILFLIIIVMIIIIITARYQISKGDDGEVNVEVVVGTQADQAADEE